ncbi:hypothetical protein [Rathayibacter rathayi]|uniref:hypothetical protein n=1 Tax=Rathayibacter rathayi TaxID=33887 RepID=UPI001CA493C0|nr:hypothetical protein [Rathayibacter rathayi]
MDERESPFSAVQSTWNPLERSASDALAAAHGDGWLVVVKEALANGRLVAQPIDAVAATPQHLLANLRARPLALPALAVDPANYWAERSALDWT